MATWITHLMIADAVLAELPVLDRRGFCVGNIAPDCNVENADWTSFTPSREVTHWMQGRLKVEADSERFYDEYILARRDRIRSAEEQAFLLGYYAHLVADAAFQRMIRDERRIAAVWERILRDEALRERARDLPVGWDSIKRLIPREARMREIDLLEAAYLREHPDSGYLTEILPLREFPDYIDYLPTGSIVRKIGVMGRLPEIDADATQGEPISLSREELAAFVCDTSAKIIRALREKAELMSAHETSKCEI